MKDSVLRRDKAVIILSFDDGRNDQISTAQYLQEQMIPAVFNITTGYLEGRCPDLTDVLPMSLDDLYWIHKQSLFEITAHGNLHGNSMRDITEGRDELRKILQVANVTGRNDSNVQDVTILVPVGFASPNSGMSPEFIRRHEKQLRTLGFSYVRTGSDVRTHKQLRRLCRKLGRLTHFPFLYKIAYGETLVEPLEKFCFTSVPIMADTTLKEVEAIVDLAVRRKCVCVLMFHSILDKGEVDYRSLWTWDRGRFEGLIQTLKDRQRRGELSVMTVKQYLELYEYD